MSEIQSLPVFFIACPRCSSSARLLGFYVDPNPGEYTGPIWGTFQCQVCDDVFCLPLPSDFQIPPS